MSKIYVCDVCGVESGEAIYARVHLIRIGWKRSSGQPRWQRSVRLGRFCVGCVLRRAQAVTSDARILSELRIALDT